MKSSIKIDFVDRGKGLEPVIKVAISENSEDPRDGLLKTFFQKLGGESNWLRVQFTDSGLENKYLHIYPVTSENLQSESEEMLSRVSSSNSNSINNVEKQISR